MIKLRIPAFVREDFLRKAMALMFAILVWFYVSGQIREAETFRDVPVSLTHDPNLVSLEKETVTVNVTLRGSQKRLQKIRSTDLRVSAEVPSVARGVFFYDLRLSPESVTVPFGTRVEAVDPGSLTLPVDRVDMRQSVPIRVRYAGALSEGYQISKCHLVPSVADIRGPSRILAEIKELVTEPVPLDEMTVQGFEIEVKLVPIPRVFTNIENIHVLIEITKQTVQQTYRDLPVFLIASSQGSPALGEPLPTVTVVLQGPQAVLETVDSFALRPFVDISSLSVAGRYRRPVQVWLGGVASVAVESIQPSILDVTLIDDDSDKAKSGGGL
jgi:YbbR domain-containing protein